MPKWTRETFRGAHLPHRLGILRAFRDRTGAERDEVHCGLKDGALITCRVLWAILGVKIDSRRETRPDSPSVTPDFTPFSRLPSGVTVRSFTSAEFDALLASRKITLALIAANKCVAHIDEYPNHGVDEDILDATIDATLEEIHARVSC
jgi:hypothetical protein